MTRMLNSVSEEIAKTFASQGGAAALDTDWKEIARSALLAMREPDEAVVQEGRDYVLEEMGYSDTGFADTAARKCFIGMIDVILGDTNRPPA